MVAMAIEVRVLVCLLFTLSHEFLKGGRGGEREEGRGRRGERRGEREEGRERREERGRRECGRENEGMWREEK